MKKKHWIYLIIFGLLLNCFVVTTDISSGKSTPDQSLNIPDADAPVQNWDVEPDIDHYQAVDDMFPDEDTSYVHTTTAGGGVLSQEDFNIKDLTESTIDDYYKINWVTIYGRFKPHTAVGMGGSVTLNFGVTIGGERYGIYSHKSSIDSYITFSTKVDNNPATDVNWTLTEVNDLILSFYLAIASRGYSCRLTQCYAIVSYQLGANITNEIPLNASTDAVIDNGVNTSVDVSYYTYGEVNLYDFNEVPGGYVAGIYGDRVWAQQFTPSWNGTSNETYCLRNISLYLDKKESVHPYVGSYFVEVFNATISGIPNDFPDGNLSYGTGIANDVPNSTGWVNISMLPVVLQKDVKYVFTLRYPGGNTTNLINSSYDLYGGYPGGYMLYSSNGGDSWSHYVSIDLCGWRLYGTNGSINVTLSSNSSGSWLNYNRSRIYWNQSVYFTNPNMTVSNTTYWWRANATEDIYDRWTEYVYHFTTQAMIIFGQLDGEGGGNDPLYNETPANNSWHFYQPSPPGFWTSISFDYTLIEDDEVITNNPVTNTIFYMQDDVILAQTFNVSEDMVISRVEIRGQRFGYPSFLNLSIYDTNVTGYPNNLLGTLFVDVTNMTDEYYLDTNESFNISSPAIHLEGNVTYAFAFHGEDYIYELFGIKESISIEAGTGNPYPNGSIFTYSGGEWGDTYITRDFWFNLYGIEPGIANYVNGTFDWYNITLGDWESYGSFSLVRNSTINIFNNNFSGIDNYWWRVSAVASEGATHAESWQFTTFYLADKLGVSAVVYLPFCAFSIPFFMIGYEYRKKKAQQE